MKSKSRISFLPLLFSLFAGGILFLYTACSDPTAESMKTTAGKESGEESKSRAISDISDKPLAPYQEKLLDLAFKAASAHPINPHIKTRSREQEAVVKICLELDQPKRALGYIEQIDNWRRGLGYADFAFYCVEHGYTVGVEHYLDLAGRIADERTKDNLEQAWRIDRIRVRIAQTHVLLGDSKKASRLEANLDEHSEMGKVDVVRTKFMDEEAFDSFLDGMDQIVKTGSLDQVRNAMETCANLFERFYDDMERRSRAVEKIITHMTKVPRMVAIEILLKMADFALDHDDEEQAIKLVTEARSTMEGSNWLPEDRIPMIARIIELQYRSGNKDEARSEADAALSYFNGKRDEIVDIWRAGALRPLAEAYHAMGDRSKALEVYGMAVEEGVQNVNSRPRAEDLSATCRSMALKVIEPDADLWSRMLQIYDELGQPW
jgi:hypothetical protein